MESRSSFFFCTNDTYRPSTPIQEVNYDGSNEIWGYSPFKVMGNKVQEEVKQK